MRVVGAADRDVGLDAAAEREGGEEQEEQAERGAHARERSKPRYTAPRVRPAWAGAGVLDGRAAVLLLPEVGVPHPSSFSLADLLPFVPVVAGLALCVVRFRAHDALGGLAFGLGGMVLMVVLALRQSKSA